MKRFVCAKRGQQLQRLERLGSVMIDTVFWFAFQATALIAEEMVFVIENGWLLEKLSELLL